MINLNDKKEFGGQSAIFNDGKAGLVENVEISIAKKTSADHDQAPDYNLIVKDDLGEIKQGYYYKPSGDRSKEEVENIQKLTTNRMLDVARAVVGQDYEFPNTDTYPAAMDMLAGLIRDNAKDKKFKVFTTYGTTNYPKAFMELRFFNCILPQESGRTLTASPRDMMTPLRPDAPAGNSDNWATSGTAPTAPGDSDDDWLSN